VALALAVVGVATWLWGSDVAAKLWQEALAFLAPQALSLLLMVGSVLAILLLWLLPKWQVQRTEIDDKARRFELENEARTTIAQILGGAAFLAGLYLTAQTLRVNEEGQITERFTKAIEQVGSEKVQVRLGGIYALERIARDSERDQGPIVEVLTAYVRENAPLKEQPKRETKPIADSVKAADERKRPATDIQTILTVLSQPTFSKVERHRVDFHETDLQGANLVRADLEGANLAGADLEGANLAGANLQRAKLTGANLEGANLSEADLRGASLGAANLRRADLRVADLRGAFVLQYQIDTAIIGPSTKCGDSLKCGPQK
jgi:hypothetical protein